MAAAAGGARLPLVQAAATFVTRQSEAGQVMANMPECSTGTDTLKRTLLRLHNGTEMTVLGWLLPQLCAAGWLQAAALAIHGLHER